MLRKSLALAVILLFVGVAFTSSINGNSTSEKDITENIKGSFTGISNRNCLIRGEITNAESFSIPYLLSGLWWLGFPPGFILDEMNVPVLPIKLWNSISFGKRYTLTGEEPPSVGWIRTIGIDGFHGFEGSFFGNIDDLPVILGLYGAVYYLGVKGFIGIMKTDSNTGITHIVGYAREFSISFSQ